MKVGDKVIKINVTPMSVKTACIENGITIINKGDEVIISAIVDNGTTLQFEGFSVGNSLGWWKTSFRKAEPRTNTLSKELAEEFIKKDLKVKEQELEKVFSLIK